MFRTRMFTTAAVVASLSTLALVAPGAASAKRISHLIVPQRSVAGFKLGVTPSQVKRRLGRPSVTIHTDGRISLLTYDRQNLSFGFDVLQRSDPADIISAIGGPYHTSKGIRVGSGERAVKRAYRGLKCNLGQCMLWAGTPGAVGVHDTGFTFFHGKVDGIDIQTSYE